MISNIIFISVNSLLAFLFVIAVDGIVNGKISPLRTLLMTFGAFTAINYIFLPLPFFANMYVVPLIVWVAFAFIVDEDSVFKKIELGVFAYLFYLALLCFPIGNAIASTIMSLFGFNSPSVFQTLS